MPDHELLATLQPETGEWVEKVFDDYEMGAHHVRLVFLIAQAWDTCQAARAILAEKGTTYDDRWGCPRPRPEVAIERDARLAYAKLLRQIDLDAPLPRNTNSGVR